MEPSAYGFRSIRARSRKERLSKKDKVALEKGRIAERVGFAARMQRENAPATSAGLTTCVENGAGYISDADRFHSDTSGEEFMLRQEMQRKKEAAIEFRKNASVMREESRWKDIEERKSREEEYYQRVRDQGLKGVKNQSCVAFNIVSLDYNATDNGEAQQYVDNMVRYRAELRKHELVRNGETRASYNIINGSDKGELTPPKEVVKPESYHRATKVDRRRT